MSKYRMAEILLGLIFVVFGVNGFWTFLPPPALTTEGQEFILALVKTGYLLSLVKALEVVAGIMLLSGHRVPLAILFLLPIIVNIVLFHSFLSPGLGLPIVIVILLVIVLFGRRELFEQFLK